MLSKCFNYVESNYPVQIPPSLTLLYPSSSKKNATSYSTGIAKSYPSVYLSSMASRMPRLRRPNWKTLLSSYRRRHVNQGTVIRCARDGIYFMSLRTVVIILIILYLHTNTGPLVVGHEKIITKRVENV